MTAPGDTISAMTTAPTPHEQTPEHRQYDADIKRWHALGDRIRARFGKPVHTADRPALAALVDAGALPPDHGIAARDVYAYLAPTRHAARLSLMVNRLGPRRHPGWGPVPAADGRWLYVLDLRPAVAWHQQQAAAYESTCGCRRDRP
jgi:hypothetical protein